MTKFIRYIALISFVGLLGVLFVSCPTGTESNNTKAPNVSLTTPQWAEGVAIAALAEVLLEEELNYDVTVEYLNVDDGYSSVADGTNDAFMDAWLPNIHESYWNTYGANLDDRGAVYTGAISGLVVPQYVADAGITALSDLAGATTAADFDNEIVGIDPGAGIMSTVEDDLMPDYGLDDDYTLVGGSGDSMESALDTAIAANEYIVVTLWRPHRLFEEYDLHMLTEDGADVFSPDEIRVLARSGLEDDDPTLAAFFTAMELSDDELASLIYHIDESTLSTPDAASEWKAQNSSVWSGWVTTD